MKANTEIKSAVMTPAAKIEWIQEALDTNNYRVLQRQLKALRDAQMVRIEICLNESHKALKAQAERLIAELQPLAQLQDATATIEEKMNKVIASIPEDAIANNCNFSKRINTGTEAEKIWLTKKDKDGSGVTFVKTACARYYECYAGDALRAIALLGMNIEVRDGVLRTDVRTHYAQRLQQDAKAIGLTLHLYDRD